MHDIVPKNNRALTDDVRTLLQRALEINPHNVTALGLLGMAALSRRIIAAQ